MLVVCVAAMVIGSSVLRLAPGASGGTFQYFQLPEKPGVPVRLCICIAAVVDEEVLVTVTGTLGAPC